MNGFSKYITHAGEMPPKADLAMLLRQYPWFMTARILLAGKDDGHDALLALHRLSHAHALIEDEPVMTESSGQTDAGHENSGESGVIIDSDLIDSFLSKGEYRIVPDENITEYDAAEESSVLDISDDLISEELAEIYLAQGLNAQAKEIYARLSLLNPEKSVYFAEIIGKIDSGNK